MIYRFDQITVDLPESNGPNPNAAAAVQELLGGKFGEMSTLMNYTFQSFNFRGKTKVRPFYDLISNIAAEEYSHIEAVSAAINLLLTGDTTRGPQQASKKAARVDAAKNLVTSGRPTPPRSRIASITALLPFHRLRPDGAADGFRWAVSGRGRTCSPAAT